MPEESNYERKLPSDSRAEDALLGSILILPEAIDDVSPLVEPADFLEKTNGALYRELLAMNDNGKAIDSTLIHSHLMERGPLKEVGGLARLAELARMVPTAAHAVHYAGVVRDCAVKRRLVLVGSQITTLAFSEGDAGALAAQAESLVYSTFDTKSASLPRSFAEVMYKTLERFAQDNSKTTSGLPTGYIDFDRLTGGLQKGELVIVAARPSMGKSAFAGCIAKNVAQSGESVLMCSMEMKEVEIGGRLLSATSGVSSYKMREKILTTDDRRLLTETAARMNEWPLFVEDKPMQRATDIASAARRIKRKHGLALVVIDYLQLIEPANPRDPREQQVAQISKRLKGLAGELDIPVLCLAQLNRGVDSNTENKPTLANLRESGSIEQDADVVMFVHRPPYFLTDESEKARRAGEAELLIRKNRNGRTGDVSLVWMQDTIRFENAALQPAREHANYNPSFSRYEDDDDKF